MTPLIMPEYKHIFNYFSGRIKGLLNKSIEQWGFEHHNYPDERKA